MLYSFVWQNNIPSYGYVTFYLVDGHLGCFHFLAVMNNIAMSISVCVLTFLGTIKLFSKATAPFYILNSSCEGFSFSTSLPTLGIVSILFVFCFLVGWLFLLHPWHVEVLGQGSNPCCSCNLLHSCSHPRSLTLCATRELLE